MPSVYVALWLCGVLIVYGGESTARYERILQSAAELQKDVKEWRNSAALEAFAAVQNACENLQKRLDGLNHTVQNLRTKLMEENAAANELYELEDFQLRLLSNLTGKFAVLQSKIVHLDDERISDTIEAAFNKPSPRKNQMYESVRFSQANKSKDFAAELERLMRKEGNFVVIYLVLGLVRDMQVWIVLLVLWCMLSRVRDRQYLHD